MTGLEKYLMRWQFECPSPSPKVFSKKRKRWRLTGECKQKNCPRILLCRPVTRPPQWCDQGSHHQTSWPSPWAPQRKRSKDPCQEKQAPHRFGAASHTQLLVPALQRKAAQRMAPTWMTWAARSPLLLLSQNLPHLGWSSGTACKSHWS